MRDLESLFNWRRVDARLTTSGQPSEKQLGALCDLGVTQIVNLGLHSHERALPDERASVQALGMAYTYLPVAFDNPVPGDFARFCTALEDARSATVHVHCIANLRVTAFLYKYWRDVEGWPEAEARALMDTVWRPGGVWAAFIGDAESIALPHRPPAGTEAGPA
jgi:protein tyrosine phosphatase (PTP) superfamily phosphohydrolase (DUF442 family)